MSASDVHPEDFYSLKSGSNHSSRGGTGIYIALMQEPDSDTYFSNRGLHYSHPRTSPPFIYATPRTTNHQKIGFFRSSSESRARRFPSLPRMAVHTEGG
jgi:hypothetical protein